MDSNRPLKLTPGQRSTCSRDTYPDSATISVSSELRFYEYRLPSYIYDLKILR